MSIRLRLALWFTAFLALMFLVFAPLVYFSLERELLLQADRWLAPFSDHVRQALRSSRDPSAPITVQEGALESFASPGVFVEMLDSNGRPIARSSNLTGEWVSVPDDAFATAWWGTPASYTATMKGQRYRALLAPLPGAGEPRGFILVVSSLQEEDAALGRVRFLLLAGNALGLLLAVGVSWLIARNGLKPIEEITQTARAIALSHGLGRRLKVGRSRDEVGRLAVTFNEMLASLDAAYEAQRRFVSDASHELRSPLTSIRSNVEFLRRALDAPREDREEALADVAAEVERMSRLTSDLLLLAKADAGHTIEMGKVALDGLVAETHRQRQGNANGVTLEMGEVQPVAVLGNATWLKQLLLILLDNAFKYTPQGGIVNLSLQREGGMAVVRVRDTGIGVSPEDLPHIFERFYRADKARARDEGGTGLGLAIARW
ncbi:MAG: sensor histidine kinase, partial [Chloroflexota bacterium]